MKQKQLTYFLVCVVGTAVFLTAYTLLFACTCLTRYQKVNRQFPIFRQFFQYISETEEEMEDFLVNEEPEDYQKAEAALEEADALLSSLRQQINEPRITRELVDLSDMTDAMQKEMARFAAAMEEYHAAGGNKNVDAVRTISAQFQEVAFIYSAIQDRYDPLNEMMMDHMEIIYQKINRKSILALAAVIFAAAVNGVILYIQIYHIHYAFSEPVNCLINSARLVAEEDFDQAEIVLEDEDIDEGMRLLLQVFNQMIVQIKQRMETLRENARVQKLLQESRFKELQMQINPHFMFNTMNMIADYAYLENADKTVLLLNHTARMFRFSLDFSGKTVTLEKELAELEHYLYIQRQRFGKRIQFIEEIPAVLPELPLPSLTLQPLVENAVTHGVGMKRTDAKIWITVADFPQQGFCRIAVSDNGQGLSPQKREAVEREMYAYNGESGKIGLGNVYLRLKLLWGEALSVEFTGEEGKGTEFAVRIDYGSCEKPQETGDCGNRERRISDW